VALGDARGPIIKLEAQPARHHISAAATRPVQSRSTA